MKNEIKMVLTLFDGEYAGGTATQTTTSEGLSVEMKTFYSDYLIDVATPLLVHDQWAQKRPIPKNHGKTIEFRKYSPLEKALTPLTEGVTPKGNNLNVSKVEATIYQYGDWIRMSDMLLLTAIDNNMVEAIDILGDQAGRTLDTITREVLNGGTNVFYAPAGTDEVIARHAITPACKMTTDLTFKVAAHLKTMNAKTLDGNQYVQIIHPNVAYDLMKDPLWQDAQKYKNPEKIYNGEIGSIGQVRYVETSEAKIFRGADLAVGSRNLKVASAVETASATIPIAAATTGGTVAADSLVGRFVLISGYKYKVKANATNSITIQSLNASGVWEDTSITVAANTVIYPGEGGAEGISVYSSVTLGANAYGTTEVTGGGLEHIVCQLGSGGTSDPLKQRATAGWKATKAVCRLVEEYICRIESSATVYNQAAN
jgi:N4-gp56 family major capsid protein